LVLHFKRASGDLAQRGLPSTKRVDDRNCTPDRKVTCRLIERLGHAAHHIAVEHSWKNVHLHILHAHGYSAIGVQNFCRCAMIPIAPNDADSLSDAAEFRNVVKHLRSMARDTGGVAKALAAQELRKGRRNKSPLPPPAR